MAHTTKDFWDCTDPECQAEQQRVRDSHNQQIRTDERAKVLREVAGLMVRQSGDVDLLYLAAEMHWSMEFERMAAEAEKGEKSSE